jgi:hypothetical protein
MGWQPATVSAGRRAQQVQKGAPRAEWRTSALQPACMHRTGMSPKNKYILLFLLVF